MVLRLLLSALLLLSACASPGDGAPPPDGPPDWLLDPFGHPSARRAVQFAEVGVAAGTGGRAREAARRRALDQINASIQVAVRSDIELRTRSLSVNGEVDWSEELDESIRLASGGDLPGHEVLDTWRDPATHETHVLVAVRRDLLLDDLLPGVEQALAAAEQHLQASAADPVARLTGLLAAHGRLSPALAVASRAHVIAQGSRDERRTDGLFATIAGDLEAIQAELAALGSRLVIDKLAGDGQQGALDGPLDEPLVARFRYRGEDGALIPLAGLPVAFVPVDGPGTAITQQASTTDAEGVISAQVSALAPTGQADSRLTVGPDVARFSATLPASRLPRASFAYGLPTPARTRVLVCLEERFAGRPTRRQSLGHALADHLTAHGFDVEVLPPDSGPGRELLRRRLEERPPDPQDLRVILRGVARAWVSTEEHDTFFFRAAAELELLDHASGQLLAIATQDGQARWAAGTADEPAAAGAFRALEPVLEAAVDRQFVSRYRPELASGEG